MYIVIESKKLKILKNFETQTGHLISVRRPELVLINKKRIWCLVDFAVLAELRGKTKESKKKKKKKKTNSWTLPEY